MPKQTTTKGGRAQKMERTSNTKPMRAQPKSNKTAGKSSKSMPATDSGAWVSGYTRADGTKVEGYYRETGSMPQPTRGKSK